MGGGELSKKVTTKLSNEFTIPTKTNSKKLKQNYSHTEININVHEDVRKTNMCI